MEAIRAILNRMILVIVERFILCDYLVLLKKAIDIYHEDNEAHEDIFYYVISCRKGVCVLFLNGYASCSW